MEAPLPVIATRLADRRDRGYLAWVAVANEVANLRLDEAPIDGTPHALEIHVQGFDEPLVVIAEPVGEPTSEGFPLRLRPLDDAQAETLRAELFGGKAPAAEEQPKRTVSYRPPRPTHSEPPLSVGHRQALARSTGGVGPVSTRSAERRAPGSLVGRTLGDGRFSLESLIGAGASGEVYRGTHSALRKPIAIKVLHPALQHSPDYCARFYSEALAASQLDHRNVLRILDYGQEPDGLLYIVMELLEGTTLEDILQREGAMSTARVIDLVSQACAGIAAAHDAGVVHRDIKPENIVVVERKDDEGGKVEIVKVCDFGIAHWQPSPSDEISDDADTLIKRPDSSKAVGTPAYMAPEQIRNETVDARADVYALGAVLYELATGKLPFDSPIPMQILMKHLNEAPVPPSQVRPGVEPALERVILKALEKDPKRRQNDARVLRSELRALTGDDPSAMGTSGRHRAAPGILVPTSFLDRTEESLAALAALDDVRTRCLAIESLAHAVKTALGDGRVALAKDLLGWLQTHSAGAASSDEEREQIDRALRVQRDRGAAAGLATAVLEGKVARVEDAASLLAAGGPVAAHALVEARKTHGGTLEVRARFVAALRAVGAAATPILVNALEATTNLVSRNEEALAEDLLRALPESVPETAGDVTVKLVRLDKPAIGTLAIGITAGAWKRRAIPLLLGVLDRAPESMRVAAIEGLKRVGPLEDAALDRLARMIAGQIPSEDGLRVAAARAFAAAAPECRPRAIAFLQQQLQPPQGFMSSVLQAFGKGENVELILALARALAAIDPGGARPVLERYAAARTELRPEIDKILRTVS